MIVNYSQLLSREKQPTSVKDRVKHFETIANSKNISAKALPTQTDKNFQSSNTSKIQFRPKDTKCLKKSGLVDSVPSLRTSRKTPPPCQPPQPSSTPGPVMSISSSSSASCGYKDFLIDDDYVDQPQLLLSRSVQGLLCPEGSVVCSTWYFIRMFSEMTSQIPKIWMKPYSRGWTPILLNRKTKTMKEIKRTTIVPLERLSVTVNWQKINLGMPPMEVCLTKRASTARQWASTLVSLSSLQSKLSSYSIYHILSLSHQEHNNDDRLYSKPEWHYPRRDGYEYLAF